jgi:leucyl aminopeptidase (aminopeptidase T)
VSDAGSEAVLARGAANALGICLNVGRDDRLVLFTDAPTAAIGAALEREARARTDHVLVVRLEELGPRPLLEVPNGLFARLQAFAPTVSVLAAQGQPGEIRFRIPLGRHLQGVLRTRHGHMIGITEPLMATGMAVDYRRVATVTERVWERVRGATTIAARNADGTDLVARFDPAVARWVPWTGLLHRQGDWGNLPEGETFTCPASVDGTLTARLIGDHFARTYGLLETPLRLTLEGGRLVAVEHPDAGLRAAFERHLDGALNGRRVGEFALGTNVGISEPTGNLLQDEKLPGLHVAFGDPYGHLTGAAWQSDVHVDVVPFGVDLEVDGEVLIRGGAYVDEVLGA